ncbi:hypothetical protein C8F01DRAFT_551631 [Mycena amicta]|nr:hypothetical protein C8F01DRAFT_551631 [Mycena amicta]
MVAAADFPLVVPPERIQRRMSLGDLLNSEDLHRFATEDDPAAIVKGEEQETQPPAIPHGILPKPPLQSFPPLYQGGIYQKNGIVKGYFLSGFGALRDRWEHDGKFIISHGGGKAESLVTTRGPRKKVISEETDQNKAPNAGQEAEASAATGQAHKQFVRPASDQTAQDASVRALMKNFETGQPLVLLIDDKYAHFPFDLSARGVYMTILGFYRVIHAWAEYQPSQSNPNGKVVRYKFAFQWCEGQGDPWWIPGPPTPMDLNESCVQGHETTTQSSPTLTSYTCSICGTTARQIYSPTWICLNPSCVRFFYGYVGNDAWRLLPYGADLEYKPDFLSLVDRDPLPSTFCNSLLPPPPNVNPEGGVMTNYASTRGWHCAECGRVSCRSAWEHYQCPNCNKTYKIVGSIRPARPLMAPPLTLPKDFVEGSFKLSSYAGVQCLPKRYFLHANPDEIQLLGTCQTFVLPDNRGKIHLIRSNISALKEADNIFESYQQQAFDGTLVFRRYPLRNHKLRGSLLTSYFSQNSGETYRYVGGTENTTPFDRAPSAVLRARDLIQKRIQEALDQPQEFNEILSAAYMERQEMGFHTDSEPGLGPVVAGLSMGSPALMRFRLALQYTPVGIQRQTLLTVVLRHGDVCVMDGADVQKFYEHTVVPTNFRIAATARWISPDKHLLPVKHMRIARPVLASQTPIVKMEIECGGGPA